MIVKKIIPEVEMLPTVGESLQIIPSNYKNREEVERTLEQFRKDNCPDEISRFEGSFVIPNIDDIEGLAHEYALKYARFPNSEAIVYLLEIETQEIVSWHDHDKYNDLCRWVNPVGKQIGNKEELVRQYWEPVKFDDCESPQGLIKSGKIIGIQKCRVTHNSFTIL